MFLEFLFFCLQRAFSKGINVSFKFIKFFLVAFNKNKNNDYIILLNIEYLVD